MPDVIKKLSIKGTTNDTRDIGAEGQYIELSYDANGDIIEDITIPGVVIDHTDSLTKELNARAPKSHADSTDQYGAGTATEYGHIKLGIGLERASNGTTQVKYGTSAQTAVEGNDARMSNPRKNPNAITFTDGTNNVDYDGSAVKTITYSDVGAAKKNHASATTDYGVASTNNYGHVKIKSNGGIKSTTGEIELMPATKSRIGGVIPDGDTVTVDPDGTIHGAAAGGSTISIYTEEATLFNRDITISSETGTNPVTATFDSTGYALVRGYTGTGLTTFSSSPAGGGDPAVFETYIPYFSNYTATLSFWAAPVTITTSTTQMYGQTVVVKKDNLEVGRTTFDNNGTATFTVHNAGTYVFECTLGWRTFKSDGLIVTDQIPYSTTIVGFVATVNIRTSDQQLFGKTIVVTADDIEIPSSTVVFNETEVHTDDKATYYAYKPANYTFSVTVNS